MAARLFSAALRSHRRTESSSSDEILSSLAKAASASKLRSLVLWLPLLRRAAFFGISPRGDLPADYDWWYRFGYALTLRDPSAVPRILKALDRLDVNPEALFMGALAAATLHHNRAERDSIKRVDGPVASAVRLATGSLTNVHPAILRRLEQSLAREFERSGRDLRGVDALSRVGWPAGVVLSVMKESYERAEDGRISARSLRDVLVSILGNWPSFVWSLIGRLTAAELSRRARLATLDAMIDAGFWAEAVAVIRVAPELNSEEVAEEAQAAEFPLAAAAILSTLSSRGRDPIRRWRLLMKAGRLAVKSGKSALAGVLFQEAAETLRPHADSGAPVLAQYHEALERAALAFTESGLKHRAFRAWAELKLSTAGVREAGIDLPGVAEVEARATLWIAEFVSEVSHAEAAGWYLKAASLFEELGAESMAEYARKRAAMESVLGEKFSKTSGLGRV